MNDKYIVVIGRSKLESAQLILYGWFRNLRVLVVGEDSFSRMMSVARRIFFTRRYVEESVEKYEGALGDYKGLWYKLNEEVIDLTLRFYEQNVKGRGKFVEYYNRLLRTKKFEAYIKKTISLTIFDLLKQLHLARLSAPEKTIIIIKNAINESVVKHMENEYGMKYNIKSVTPLCSLATLFIYYAWLFGDIFRRGFVFRRQTKQYKLSKEASSGFLRKPVSDDIAIDGKVFTHEDILLLRFHKDNNGERDRAYQEARRRGFGTADIAKLKINVTGRIFNIAVFYLVLPLKTYFEMLLNRQTDMFYYIFLFHKKCFPFELLLNLYSIKCHISNRLWGDIEETIILNKYGAKNAILHLSDLTTYKAHFPAFLAHNAYFVWGDIHYDFHSHNYFIDKKINIGCIFKETYSEALRNREEIVKKISGYKGEKKIVAFFDAGFGQMHCNSEDFLLRYLGIIKEFLNSNGHVRVILKMKDDRGYESEISEGNLERFKSIWNKLVSLENFTLLDTSRWTAEEAISVSDVSISMGMNSPATIALICGRNALYFDDTGNIYHPFAARYKNKLVFDDKDIFLKQVNDILEGKFNCTDVITREEIRKYDAFDDDKALERLRHGMHELTLLGT